MVLKSSHRFLPLSGELVGKPWAHNFQGLTVQLKRSHTEGGKVIPGIV